VDFCILRRVTSTSWALYGQVATDGYTLARDLLESVGTRL